MYRHSCQPCNGLSEPKGMLTAAQVLALTGLELIRSPQLLARAKTAFRQHAGGQPPTALPCRMPLWTPGWKPAPGVRLKEAADRSADGARRSATRGRETLLRKQEQSSTCPSRSTWR